jgi:hypothetical protein
MIHKEKDIFADETSVYHSTTWTSKKGSRVQQIEEILSESKRPMHFGDVYKVLKEKYPLAQELTHRIIHHVLSREEGAFLLWDRGIYIHRKFVMVPSDLMCVIENWLVNRLTNIDSPLILIGAAWRIFERQCLEKGLISEYALYTCLRISNSSKLIYPKHPQIYLKKGYRTRIPYTLVLEDYVINNGGTVLYEDLRSFAIDTLGLKDYQFRQGLARINSIFRNVQGEYVSVAREIKNCANREK